MADSIISSLIPAIITGLLASIPGFYSIYLQIKKSIRHVKAVGYQAGYKVGIIEGTQFEVLIGKVKLTLLNDRDDSVTITDIIGTIKYDKKKYDKHDEMIIKSTSHELPYISVIPQNFSKVIPIIIKSHEAIKIDLDFVFPQVIVNLLNRSGHAKLKGFIGGTPIVEADEIQFIKEWDNLPLIMYITLHVDAKENIRTMVLLEKEDSQNIPDERGTYSAVEIAIIGKNIWDGKRK
jgi:hypothetical protein